MKSKSPYPLLCLFILFSNVAILLSARCAEAGAPDTLLNLNELTFNNDFEKKSFEELKTSEPGSPDIFLNHYSPGSVTNIPEAKSRISECINYLQKETGNKPESKKIKFIYDYIHKTFFKVYKLENSFCDIFNNGEYNCVSATAFYALIFQRMNIPFQVKELPQHVYLIAYPESSKILIETTSPEKGYHKYTDEFIAGYAKSLYKSKLISKEHYNSTTPSELFNKYYFSSENISIIQLAGLQYMNYGIYLLEDKDYQAAVIAFKKAYYIYPSAKTRFILNLALTQLLSKSNYKSIEQAQHLSMFCRLNSVEDDDDREAIEIEFSRLLRAQLIENSDFALFDSSFKVISASISDSALLADIKFAYHFELARLGTMNLKDTSYQFYHLRAAYQVNPNNANLHSLIVFYFGRVIENNNDVAEVVSTMQNFSKDFQFIDSNEYFVNVNANCLLENSYRSYSMDNINKGDNYLKEFETLLTAQPTIKPNENFIDRTYMTAAGVYYKRGNHTRSKQLIKTGLMYNPSSFGLKQMLNQF